ncbi:MAG: outer membrane beta-barrel domain-containing protein [Myxococcales bacterium]|nr:outer membrane beta-barrel domain-containing protein [Myxococcales bacterium]
MRRANVTWFVLGALLLASAPAWAQKGSEDEAGDVSEVDKDAAGPLRERIRPVSGHLFLMDGRFEVSPTVGLSFRDAFWTKLLFGVALTYHLNETMALSLHGGYTLSLISGSAQICTPPIPAMGGMPAQPGACRSPTYDELTRNEGQPANKSYGLTTLLTSVDFQWAPIYGKISLFAEKTLSFNMYVLGGPTFVLYGPTSTPTIGGNLGFGFRFIINEWMTVRAELRDVLYYESGFLPPSAPPGTPGGSFRNQLMFELGFSMFFPTIFKEED